MELHQLRYFARAADLGGFTRAAAACHVSQPSLSQQILKLEQELGRPLFDRVGRQVRLTEAGRLLKPYADQILAQVDEAKARLADDAECGRLVISALPTIAPYLLPPLLQAFSAEHPRVQVEVNEDVTADALRKCVEGTADLAILALPASGERLHIEPLFTEELLLVMPAGHRLESRARVTLKDVAEESFVLLNDAHCLTRDALSFCHRRGFEPIVTSRMSQLLTVQELVALGRGVSLVPAMARRLDASPSRVYRSLSGEKPTRTIALAWHEQRFHTALFGRFVDWLRAATADGDRLTPGP